MTFLIDTHTLLWIVTHDRKLSENAQHIYLNSENVILCSIVSIWELAIKVSLQKLSLAEPLKEFVELHIHGNDIKVLKLEISHILHLEKLPYHHRDPFDRLIIAQSIYEHIPILSSDNVFDRYPVNRVW